MEKFLKETASYLLSGYQDNLSGLTVIFPNRRAGLFFQKYLSEMVSRPIFSPRIMTITELVESITPLQKGSPEGLIIELWKTFTRETGHDESLDDFYFWGEMLLSDFNETDKYLVDAKKLFSNIESLREIDVGFDFLTPEQIRYLSTFWKTILEVKNSSDKQRFLSVWKKLSSVYDAFNKKLRLEGWGYEGMIYRDMANIIDGEGFSLSGNDWAIIGFNALNSCEQKLFRYLKNKYSAGFFWDYDDYYFHNTHHEASHFLRENLSMFPPPNDFQPKTNSFSTLDQVKLIAVPGFSGQAIVASRWLEENLPACPERFDHTALVLCNESLLIPVLNNLPSSTPSLNITMGFPLRNAPAYSLLKNLIDLDRNSRPDPEGKPMFYYRPVISLLNHPLISPKVKDAREELTLKIRQKNQVYLSAPDFAGDPFLTMLFCFPEEASEINSWLRMIILSLVPELPENDLLARESFYQLILTINRLHQALFGNEPPEEKSISKKLLYQLILRHIDRVTVPFEGEPLSGIQLMGFLETRCLDFDRVILLSFNDDQMPGNAHRHSFVPYNLRRGFGLPLPEHHNAMYSYYFFRLIQRAKNVTLVYDTRTEGMTKGEVSRFALQLKYEARHLKLIEEQAVFPFESVESKTIEIEKKGLVTERTVQFLTQKGLSPSALNSYIDCSLKFYFRYLEGLHEADDVSEDIDQVLFGRIAHKALEELYRPMIGKTIQAGEITHLLNDRLNLENSLRKALHSEYFKGGTFKLNGKNRLIFDIIREYVTAILKYDLGIAPIQLLGLENSYSDIILIESGEQTIRVKITGFIDRLDKVGSKLRVIDYKTGKDKNEIISIEKLFLPAEQRNKAALQTLFYARCLQPHFAGETEIMPAVYGANSIFVSGFNPCFQYNKKDLFYQDVSAEFEVHLKNTIREILDTSVPFLQTENDTICSYCEFNAICNRKRLPDW